MTIEQLIEIIGDRPELYLSEATLSRFEAFLLGWRYALRDSNADNVIRGFDEWISTRNGTNTTHGWARIIRLNASNDVTALQDAISLFKEYFNSINPESDSIH